MTGRILKFRPAPARKAEPPRATPASTPARDRGDAPPLTPGEAERFRTLVLPHLDAAYSFARYLCRNPTEAEDLVQDAFVRAMRHFAGYRGGDPRAWLFAIVRSRFQEWAGARRAQGLPDDLEDIPSEADTPETALVRQSETAAVRGAIETLPEPFREALVLRELEDLSYREIAEITAAPIGTVMSRLARARQMLLVALGPRGETP